MFYSQIVSITQLLVRSAMCFFSTDRPVFVSVSLLKRVIITCEVFLHAFVPGATMLRSLKLGTLVKDSSVALCTARK